MSESWFTREINNIIETSEKPAVVIIKSSDYLETIITFNIKGNPHSFDDKAAVIRPDGTMEWYNDGLLDRNKKPAVITPYNTQLMPPINPDTITEREKKNYEKSIDRNLQNTGKTIKFFRQGLLNDPKNKTPAVQYPDGGYEHYKNGKLHYRKGYAVSYSDGTLEHHINGLLHNRKEYAQITPDGTKRSFIKGKLESINGLPSVILPDGTKEWHRHDLLNRCNDLPSIERPDGTKEWYKNGIKHRRRGPAKISPDGRFFYKNGKLHRSNGPAVKMKNGRVEHYYNGLLHRDKNPAIIEPSGLRMWYFMGKLHSYDGNPSVIYPDGTIEYHLNGQKHRVDNPAIIRSNGTREWYKNDKRHNASGPAIVYPDSRKPRWFINGIEMHDNLMTRKIASTSDIKTTMFQQKRVQITPIRTDRRKSVIC